MVVYGSPYDSGKLDFINELHTGSILIGGDFNLVRTLYDKK